VSDNTRGWEIRFTKSARRHRIGRASALHVLATIDPTPVTTSGGAHSWLYVGPDERRRELDIVALEVADAVQPYLLVIHVMPTQLRG
jgi:hypothetical protein